MGWDGQNFGRGQRKRFHIKFKNLSNPLNFFTLFDIASALTVPRKLFTILNKISFSLSLALSFNSFSKFTYLNCCRLVNVSSKHAIFQNKE